MDTQRFVVGQTVRLRQSILNRGKSIECEIMQVMPFDGVSFQYRVRGEDERFERIAQQHELAEIMPEQAETADAAGPGTTLKPPSLATKGNR